MYIYTEYVLNISIIDAFNIDTGLNNRGFKILMYLSIIKIILQSQF